jgi:Ala-tRNA(Pro) deacylase
MPGRKVREYLDINKVKYMVVKHSPAYTAQEVAQKTHISGKEVAKTVMVTVDGRMAMVVLPATCGIDFHRLKKLLGVARVDLAGEDEFRALFPDCEAGAMPPFGNLYDMTVYVDESLSQDTEIAFNAGTHTEVIRMLFEDYEGLVNPKMLNFACAAV